MILLVASKKDQASINIAKQIIENYSFENRTWKNGETQVYVGREGKQEITLIIINEELVYAQNVTDFSLAPELIIFLSRHSSESGIPTLSVHTPGNLGKASLGGIPRRLSISPANAMRTALKAMAQLVGNRGLSYKVSYECTHHGPSLDRPAMFVELGSSPKQWADHAAAKVIANAVMETIASFGKSEAQAALGIGGPHYNEKFTKIALENNIAFGHVIPKYAVSEVDEEILRQCVERTLERVEVALLDWKGIRGEDKQRLIGMLENLNLKIQKV
ncbi:MAG: D-aminoacyl-tRNA deacylase [Candidatus Bathyarchaeia archaeon]|nr:D-tyrosyl-tRNA(Tyr) deacylase [Candidatus Bathyarchaeota archaeon]